MEQHVRVRLGSSEGREQPAETQGQLRVRGNRVSGPAHEVDFYVDHSVFEERWITMGWAQDGRLLVISHTYVQTDEGETSARIISARLANRRKRRQFETRV